MRLWSIHPKVEQLKYYIAGLVDGEGSFNIKRIRPTKANKLVNPRYYISFAISMKNKTAIKIICDYFKMKMRKTKTEMFICECNDKQAYTIINNILPYLIVKYQEAKICKEFYEFKKNKPFKEKTYRKEISISYFHNKSKKILNTRTTVFPCNKNYLFECKQYFYKIKEIRKCAYGVFPHLI